MSVFQSLMFSLVSFFASIIGSICGIGGGVIIKPVLDLFGWADISVISFLSGCTVLTMSLYSVGMSILSKDHSVNLKTGTALAIGGAAGGICGKQLFILIKGMFSDPSIVGTIQSACFGIITLSALLYILNKNKIQSKHVQSTIACILIGLILGVISSFLGIGGGPVNLVVLFYFFSMNTKMAAANSLYIILFSQIASLLTTLITGTVPIFSVLTLVFMSASGIAGGAAGRVINKKIDNKTVEKLFIYLMIIIICISLWNMYHSL